MMICVVALFDIEVCCLCSATEVRHVPVLSRAVLLQCFTKANRLPKCARPLVMFIRQGNSNTLCHMRIWL